tara:strand:- start:959 stop:1150 length:192 start_codon:yes stop_codon:yes gene_type:complete
MNEKIYVILGVSDIRLAKKEAEKLPKYITAVNDKGETLAESEIYHIGYEDEDGNECDEDGNIL